MNKTLSAAFLAFAIFSSSCSTFPEPTAQGSTLLMGKLQHVSIGTFTKGTFSISGTHTEDITMYIKNLDTGKGFALMTDLMGNFIKTSVTEGRYIISRLEVKLYNGSSYLSMEGSPDIEWEFRVVGGAVNNVGQISWLTDYRAEKHFLSFDEDYPELVESFRRKYPQSLWWSMPYSEIYFPEIHGGAEKRQ